MNIDFFSFDRAQAQQAISNPLDGTNVSKHSSHFKEADAASIEDMIQQANSEETQHAQKILEDFQKKQVETQRIYVQEYLEKEYTNYSGMTHKGTSFTLNLETPEDMSSLGHYTITFTRIDGSSQTFNLNKGAGFRELEDGSILQYGMSSNELIGTEEDDILIVDNTKNINYVDGKGGNDIIISLGGKGGLQINGGEGDDQIFVSQKSFSMGSVNIHGGNGNDMIRYEGNFSGSINGDDGNDDITLAGDVSHGSHVMGGTGNDIIKQVYQNNIPINIKPEGGGEIIDELYKKVISLQDRNYSMMNGILDGGEGNDKIIVSGGAVGYDAVIKGGEGNDIIKITSIEDGKENNEEENEDISDEKKSIFFTGKIDGGSGNDLIQLKAEGDIYNHGHINDGEGDDKIIIDGDTIDMMGSTLELGEGNNSVTIKAKTKLLADFLRIYGGSGDDKLEIDAKLIEMMDAYINTKGGNDRISISGEKVNIKGAIITGGKGENGISINAEELEADGSRIDRGASIQEGVAYRQAESGKNTPPEEIRNKVVSLTSSILRLPESQSMFVKLVETIGEEKNSSVSLARKLDGLADTLNAELLRQSGKQVNARI